MTQQEFTLSGKECRLTSFGEPRVLLVEPIDRNDLGFLGRETDYLCSNGLTDFALATFLIEDWNAELTPWKADPVFGKEPFGDGEEKTRNRVMATVGDCIREQASLLEKQGIQTTLEWNPGNHFKDADIRTAKAFLWAAKL